jgi:hypothetical protein
MSSEGFNVQMSKFHQVRDRKPWVDIPLSYSLREKSETPFKWFSDHPQWEHSINLLSNVEFIDFSPSLFHFPHSITHTSWDDFQIDYSHSSQKSWRQEREGIEMISGEAQRHILNVCLPKSTHDCEGTQCALWNSGGKDLPHCSRPTPHTSI